MMKRILLLLTTMILAFAFCACSLFGGHESSDPADESGQTAKDEEVAAAVNGGIDLDSLSLGELLELYDKFLESGNEAVNDGAEYDLYYRGSDFSDTGANAEIGYTVPENVQRAIYSDGAWENKTFEALDPTANMSPEDKAGYEAAIKELENFDAEDFQKGVDEMIKSFEGFGDYDPGEFSEGDPQIVSEWPDNEITRRVPKPPFENPMIFADDDSVTVMHTGSSADEAKAYAKQLKDAGFTKDVYEETNSVAGYDIYTFTAENANGLSVSLTFVSGTTTVNIFNE